MGNKESSEKITKPQGSTIVSVQHKEFESIHDCEELRQLQQLPKTVPLRPSSAYAFQKSPISPAVNLTPPSTTQTVEIRENDVDSTRSQSNKSNKTASQYLGTSYSNKSNKSAASASSDYAQPFNPNTLRPPKLATAGMDALYKSLRQHFTALAVKADCNQVSVTFAVQSMDEELAIRRANMIDADFTTNQLQKSINSMHALSDSIKTISASLQNAVESVNIQDWLAEAAHSRKSNADIQTSGGHPH